MNLLKLVCLWFQVRAQEAFVQGQMDTIPLLHGEVRNRACLSHKTAEAELYRLKAKYRRLRRGNGIQSLVF